MNSDRQQLIIHKTADFVKATLHNAEGGHDWFHSYRVRKNAVTLAKEESADLFVVQLAALLHDIADGKFNNGDDSIGPEIAGNFLRQEEVDSNVILHVQNIIANISFKGGRHLVEFSSKELEIVQDADRLDAIGAIGIARAFSYGGFKNRRLYDPEIQPDLHMDKERYRNSQAPTINHFYEKLLLLKDRMNTAAGRKMAERRHVFMEHYLDQFYLEWEGLP
jgi:uncharacterized protein